MAWVETIPLYFRNNPLSPFANVASEMLTFAKEEFTEKNIYKKLYVKTGNSNEFLYRKICKAFLFQPFQAQL